MIPSVAMALSTALLGQVTVPPGHPRLYVRANDLPGLRARAANDSRVAAFYQLLKSRMDSAVSRHTNDEVASFELMSLALAHLIEAPSTVYRDKAVSGWLRSSFDPASNPIGGTIHWNLPYLIESQSLALDWMWDDLTPSQRSTYGQVLVTMMDHLQTYGSTATSAYLCDYSNQQPYHFAALAFVGAALAGEGINDGRAAAYLAQAQDLIENHMVPATNQEAGGDADLTRTSGFVGQGGWGEDMGHLDMTHPHLGRMLAAWRSATGTDYFPRANGLRTFGQYVVWLTRPNGRLAPKGNGSYQVGASDKGVGALGALLTARYRDSFGRTVKDRTWTGGTYGFHQTDAVLWYDSSVPPVEASALPPAMYFQGQGEVVARSGLGPQDTWVYLRSGPIYNGHQHDDQGNLLVEAYGGELLIENAGDESSNASLGLTVSHNSLRVGGDQIPYGGNAVQTARPLAGTPYERGQITSVQMTAAYTYAAADFGSAYPDGQVSPPKVGKVTREVVVILPDLVITRDRALPANSGLQVEHLLHSWNPPDVDAAAQSATIVQGTGRAWVKVLMPMSASISVAAQGPTQLITTSGPSGNAEFLHVVALSPASAPATPPTTLISESGAIGARTTDRSGDIWEVRFARNAVGLISITRNGVPTDGGTGGGTGGGTAGAAGGTGGGGGGVSGGAGGGGLRGGTSGGGGGGSQGGLAGGTAGGSSGALGGLLGATGGTAGALGGGGVSGGLSGGTGGGLAGGGQGGGTSGGGGGGSGGSAGGTSRDAGVDVGTARGTCGCESPPALLLGLPLLLARVFTSRRRR